VIKRFDRSRRIGDDEKGKRFRLQDFLPEPPWYTRFVPEWLGALVGYLRLMHRLNRYQFANSLAMSTRHDPLGDAGWAVGLFRARQKAETVEPPSAEQVAFVGEQLGMRSTVMSGSFRAYLQNSPELRDELRRAAQRGPFMSAVYAILPRRPRVRRTQHRP